MKNKASTLQAGGPGSESRQVHSLVLQDGGTSKIGWDRELLSALEILQRNYPRFKGTLEEMKITFPTTKYGVSGNIPLAIRVLEKKFGASITLKKLERLLR